MVALAKAMALRVVSCNESRVLGKSPPLTYMTAARLDISLDSDTWSAIMFHRLPRWLDFFCVAHSIHCVIFTALCQKSSGTVWPAFGVTNKMIMIS